MFQIGRFCAAKKCSDLIRQGEIQIFFALKDKRTDVFKDITHIFAYMYEIVLFEPKAEFTCPYPIDHQLNVSLKKLF